MDIEKGFGKYIEKDEKIQEEKLIEDLLLELQSYMPPMITIIPTPEGIAQGAEQYVKTDFEKWDRPFLVSKDRIEWLRNFVRDAKDKMKGVLPKVFDDTILTAKHQPSYGSRSPLLDSVDHKEVFDTGRAIRNEFESQFNKWEKEDLQKIS